MIELGRKEDLFHVQGVVLVLGRVDRLRLDNEVDHVVHLHYEGTYCPLVITSLVTLESLDLRRYLIGLLFC